MFESLEYIFLLKHVHTDMKKAPSKHLGLFHSFNILYAYALKNMNDYHTIHTNLHPTYTM